MKNLEHIRHSLAHLLAAAVLELYPDAMPSIGPAIDNGFYYDFDFSQGEQPKHEDLIRIESKMKELLPSWTSVESEKVELNSNSDIREEEIRGALNDRGIQKNKYKEEIAEEKGKPDGYISFYKMGNFIDLCGGGHVNSPAKDIDPDGFTLSHMAGAYWRGDEKNIMLTRIYGLAFENKKQLEEYLTMREEAAKRDHRKIAREQDLLVFSDLVGSGMPMWTPKGNVVRNEVINYSRVLNQKLGFGEVHTPNINKGELFKLSGHYDKYKEDMLSVRSQYVDDEMFLKPMNCPQHTQIYASQPRSYRDLPVRYSDFANLYRDERPGELSGLTRLRMFAQDDGHIFCREDQIEDEISKVLDTIEEALKTYRVGYWMRLSFRDSNKKEKYLGDDTVWERSQEILKKLLVEKNIKYTEAEGEAAFYGPKIDIMIVDALGREWQMSTVQLDFSMPARFKLTYTDSDGKEKTPIMIHRALIGSPDRFLGVLIEHYAGAFPLWLSPIQVSILPIGKKHKAYAEEIYQALKNADIRAELDTSDETLGKKIRNWKTSKTPYALVLGDEEMKNKELTVESRDNENAETLTVDELIKKLCAEIENKGSA